MTSQNPIARELLFLALLSTLWAASYTFIKIGVETMPPITFIALRTLIAGLLLYVVIRLRGLRLPTDFATWRLFFIQACINSVLPFTLIAWAEQSIDAGLAVILNATTPIFTFLLTALVIRHEPVSGRKLFGTIAGMTGVCLIIGVEALSGAGEAIWSQLAVLTAAFSYACAAIFSKNFKGLDPVMPAAGSLICGAVLLLPVSLIVDRPWTLSPSAASLTALVCLSVFSTALAFMIYFRLMQTLGSVGTTSQAYLRVPVGVAIGMAFLGEMPTPAMWVGLVCVIAGVLAMTLPSRRRRVVQGG
ncbi:EamA family transporter [Agrobacterium tumefaciens]|uniref:EamA family transporter n=1 Tax=Agrobacterium tumefaciens TaxID=358 RepID=A0AAP9E453_AGRTU|nr:EamA family transporter [Agrobacterium tumefaciens]NSZ58383.1 EamA family transporter [Agrobacterium tumefaciens]QDY94468.1 EamA family transporter [Agrobacterium tumefaciens]UXS49592.1 EamA family transporter [Agrobacterium tumefaciens]UXS70847.1 EamA family transporter [Agrobacterium tumefaciens]UXS78510.1 EamA family transporter [Agrobacterium tumefaciens]